MYCKRTILRINFKPREIILIEIYIQILLFLFSEKEAMTFT